MDLIDRQAAIDAVLHHGEIENNYTDLYHDGYCDGVYDSADILKELPSAEPKTGRWISDSERLPEDVLCVTLVTDGMAVWAETWVGIVGKWKYNHSTITAWMPLPEPWKGEDNEAD